LVAVGVIAGTGVEVAPGGVFGEGGGEVVLGFVEVEVIIFIEENGHGAVAGDGAGFADHGGDAVGILNTVAVGEEEVGGFDDVGFRDAVAAVGGAGEEAAALAVHPFNDFDEFVDAGGFEDFVVVFDVGFVIYFDE